MTTRIGQRVTVVSAAVLATLLLVAALPGADDRSESNRLQIRPGDRLYVHVTGTVVDLPIKGVYRVEPSGRLPLGPAYGRADVEGLTVEQAETRVRDQLAKILQEPAVLITWYDPQSHGGHDLPDRVAQLEREVAELRDAVNKPPKR